MLKLILICLIIVTSVLIGVSIKQYLYTKHQIYLDFKDIIKSIKTEIYFLKTNKEELLKKQICKNKSTQEILTGYLDNGRVNSIYLSQSDNIKIAEFLNNIGRNNVEGELASLEYYENIINSNCDIAYNNLNKYGSFSIKLAIIIGTLISIILI